MRRAVLTLMLLFACGGVPALSADAPVPQSPSAAPSGKPSADKPAADKPADDSRLDLQKPEGEAPPAADSWWHKVLRDAPNCNSFTDGCRTCSRTVCSNIGIACQPKEWSCNDANAKPEAKPDAKPDAKPEPRQ
jgi:hypothetical protein